jgi:hypothetical protein
MQVSCAANVGTAERKWGYGGLNYSVPFLPAFVTLLRLASFSVTVNAKSKTIQVFLF